MGIKGARLTWGEKTRGMNLRVRTGIPFPASSWVTSDRSLHLAET